MKKLLLISFESPPISSPPSDRMYSFAKYLPAFDWKPFLLTARNPFTLALGLLKLDPGLYRSLRGLQVTRAIDLQFEVICFGLRKLGLDPRAFFAFDQTLGWIPHAYALGKNLIERERIDCILASHPPPSSLMIGSMLSMKCEIPLILDYRDPWNSIVAHPSAQHRRLEMSIENNVLTRSNGIVTVSDGMKDMLLRDFPSVRNKRIEIVRNGFHSEILEAHPYRFMDRRIHILYAGSIYRTLGGGLQHVLAVLKAVRILSGEISSLPDKLQLLLIGNVANEIMDYVRRFDLGSVVTIMDHMSHRKVWGYMKAVQYLLNINCVRHGLGTKIYDYLAVGKPIINVGYEDGEAARLIAEYDVGATVRPDPTDVASFLRRLLRSPLRIERRGDVSSLSRERQTGKLAMFLNEIKGCGPRGWDFDIGVPAGSTAQRRLWD